MKEYNKPELLLMKIETKNTITLLSISSQFDNSIYKENDVIIEWDNLFN